MTTRIRSTYVTLLVLAIGLTGAVMAQAADEPDKLRASDFAVGRVISPVTPDVLQSTTLDWHVYRTSVEPGLADLRVFNGAGRAVPHAIRRAVAPRDLEPAVEVLPVFRLGPEDAHGSDGAADPSSYRIDAEVSDSGAILRLHGTAGAALPGPTPAGAWLIDASALSRGSVVGLELDLVPSAGDFMGHLRISASDDLTHFRTVTDRAAVARLTRGGYEIERLDLTLPATRARYLKLELVDGALPADVRAVGARLAPRRAPVPRRHQVVSGERIDDERGSLIYDLASPAPIDRVRLLLEEPNTLIEIQLDSATTPEGPWTRRHTGLVYRFEQGATLESAPIVWRGTGHRYLRLQVSSKGGGDHVAAPDIEVAWRPQQLLFIARGGPPFVLAYGKKGAKNSAFRASKLVSIAGAGASELDDGSASLGPPGVLAGDAAFLDPPRPVDWRQIGLWVVLVAAVAIVLALSVRLLRTIPKGNGEQSEA